MRKVEKFISKISEDLKIKPRKIAGDASFRSFYRFNKKGKKFILIFCTKNKKSNLYNYIKINKILIKSGFVAPKLIDEKIKKNYVIVEDLGLKSFKPLLSGKKKLKNYKKIIDLLIKIQNKNMLKKAHIPPYSKNFLNNETNIFFDWFLTMNYSNKKAKLIKNKINKEINKLYSGLELKDPVFVHRDFHAENLLISKNKIGIIDSQDAVKGHKSYDLTSLIDDVRIKSSESLRLNLLNFYIKKNISKKEIKNFKKCYYFFSVQRLLKIIGIFIRLYKRDGKYKYIKYIPNTWKILDEKLKYNYLDELRNILNQYCNKKKRIIKI